MTQDKQAVKELTEQWWYANPTPQDVSNFLFRAGTYIRERRPDETEAIQILRERCFDIMDAEVGRQRGLAIQ